MNKQNDALAWLADYHSDEPRLGLERVEYLLNYIGRPHLKKPVIHIAGTNGKGSTIAHLGRLLMSHGQRVGIFSSPYISNYHEQIQINFEPINDNDLQSFINKYQNIFEELPSNSLVHGITEFELITVMAYDYFYESNVDYIIMEVGMGGLLDSTNVCQPILTGITTIGFDHTAMLGGTIEEIALQKAGIIKRNIPLVTGRIKKDALKVIQEQAEKMEATHYQFSKDYSVSKVFIGENEETEFIYQSKSLTSTLFKTPMRGRHQADNATMAIQLFEIIANQRDWTYSAKSIQQGINEVVWPGRMEMLGKQPRILLDGAHNPHAMSRLKENILELYPNESIHILFSCLKTKAVKSMLGSLKEITTDNLNVTTFNHSQACTIETYTPYIETDKHYVSDWQEWLKLNQQSAKKTDVLIITGSLYFVRQVRQFLLTQLAR